MASSTGYISCSDNTIHQVGEVQKICALYEDIIKLTQRRGAGVDKFEQGSCHRLLLEDIPLGKPLVSMENNKNDAMVPLLHIPLENVKSPNRDTSITEFMSWS